jgi:hypothetical protein
VRINVLGPLEITDAGEPIEIRGSRLRVLVIRLALDQLRHNPADSRQDSGRPQAGIRRPPPALQV